MTSKVKKCALTVRNKYRVFGMIEHTLYRLLTQISRRTTVLQLIFRNDSDSDSQIQVHVHVCKAFEVLHIHACIHNLSEW